MRTYPGALNSRHTFSRWLIWLGADQQRAEGDAEVRQALSHCPQCGSGHFTEYRVDDNSEGTSVS